MSETPALKREPLSEEAIELLKKTECLGWSQAHLDLFVYQCNRSGLDPLARQIYGQLRWDKNLRDTKGKKVGGLKLSVVTSIDGFRLVAQRSGEYQGQVGPFWCGKDGLWKDVWTEKTYPVAAKVGAWRKDFREPTFGVANFDAYAPTYDDGNLSGLWPKMFALMIAKCAEALALRKAFPHELSGLYIAEEMEQAGATVDPSKEKTEDDPPKEQRAPDPKKGERSAHEPEEEPDNLPGGGNGEEDPAAEEESPRIPKKGGLANSKAVGGLKRKLTPATTPNNPMRHPQSDNDGAGFDEVATPTDQWGADELRKIVTLGNKTLGSLRKDQLQQLADMGDAYVAQGTKLGKPDIAKQALAGAKALLAFDAKSEEELP